jgi:hypothetical protein
MVATPQPAGVADDLTWLVTILGSVFAVSAVPGQGRDELIHGVGSTHVHGSRPKWKAVEVREDQPMR